MRPGAGRGLPVDGESELPIREKLRDVENSTTVSQPVTVVEEVPANGNGKALTV